MTMATPCSSSSSTDKSSDSAKNATPEPWKSPELSSKILPQDLKIEAEGVEDSNNLRIQHFNGTKKRNRIDTDTDPVHDCMSTLKAQKPESKPAEPANKKKKGNDNVEDAVSDENAERGAGQEQMSADARQQEISLHFSHFLNSMGVRHNRAVLPAMIRDIELMGLQGGPTDAEQWLRLLHSFSSPQTFTIASYRSFSLVVQLTSRIEALQHESISFRYAALIFVANTMQHWWPSLWRRFWRN